MKYLSNDIRSSAALVTSQGRARGIMGDNFFGIDESIKFFGINPTQEEFMTLLGIPFTDRIIEAIDRLGLNPTKQQLNALMHVPFSEERLKEDKDTHLLVSVFPISIDEIENILTNKRLFALYHGYRELPFVKEHGEASWHLIRKTHVEGSTASDWKNAKELKEQKQLLGAIDMIPSARVTLYAAIAKYLSNGERLFTEANVRTSTMTDPKCANHLCVSSHRDGSICLNDQLSHSKLFYVGLASERKPN